MLLIQYICCPKLVNNFSFPNAINKQNNITYMILFQERYIYLDNEIGRELSVRTDI